MDKINVKIEKSESWHYIDLYLDNIIAHYNTLDYTGKSLQDNEFRMAFIIALAHLEIRKTNALKFAHPGKNKRLIMSKSQAATFLFFGSSKFLPASVYGRKVIRDIWTKINQSLTQNK